jgi:N-acetylmuramoyl-L-alanine amidase
VRRRGPAALLPLAVASALLSGCGASGPVGSPPPEAQLTTPVQLATDPSPALTEVHQPLRGKVIVIDPGHQLGNSSHLTQINRPVDAGGFQKACNTTGTATNAGFPEATLTWKVALALRAQLRQRGATVFLTRRTNSTDNWGPCIDVRGRRGNRVHADAVVSIHGDGAASSIHGFFVIMPTNRRGWTDDIYRSSHQLGHRVKAGLVRAGLAPSTSYGGDGLDNRGDLGTLNWSNRPIVMVELGNMRNARDARHMTSPKFRRHVYARGLRMGLTHFVRHR